MAIAASPPATPEASRSASIGARPQSMYAPTISPEAATVTTKSRPQSMMIGRARNRLSMASSKGGTTRIDDDDARTAVKVVVRIRPSLNPRDPGYDLIPQRFQRSAVNVPTENTLSVESSQGRKIFIFDRVFSPDVTQKGIWAYLEDSVDSFLQGYNVSILAYGQSGAGKSYTMGTSGLEEQSDPAARGIIPRAAMHLFENLSAPSSAHSRQSSGLRTPTRYSISNVNSPLKADKTWQMTVTYVEIYNEQPRDLLLPEGASVNERATVQIREDPKGRIFVEGLRAVAVNSVEELMGILNYGSRIRQTDATAINSRSSRSHAVFTVNLRQIKNATNLSPPKTKHTSTSSEAATAAAAADTITVDSKLHFVDLAGSERLKNTGATGDRAKEGISINAGLASLGKVISQLSSRSAGGHVSYRDSKLTRMLQDSLGGNAITYMVACVTPAEFHLSETLNTVQYAQRAQNIQSKPRIQQVNEDGDRQATIERLRSEVAFLRQQIRSTESGERKPESSRDRTGATDVKLENQLLDVQEGYRALSERHAKLIGELTKQSRESQDLANEGPAERLKRSQENQQQIEQIILEYEKTIQSLEADLSTTRSSLATTEGALLERETKCAYIETMNSQLNSRVQKLMDRESSTESYLQQLEARLEDSSIDTSGQDAQLTELRREVARVRESEMNSEDYISTLEERLAEADQDIETLQREVERLEHLVERQRSLGRLDNLLYELDKVQSRQPQEIVNDHEVSSHAASISMEQDTSSRSSSVHGIHRRKQSEPMQMIQETREPEISGQDTEDDAASQSDNTPLPSARVASFRERALQDEEPSPAQSKFMQDKFESVSQELFDLRLEHENTSNELDLMSAKYQEALRTLAELQGHLEGSSASTPAETLSPEALSPRQSLAAKAPTPVSLNGQRRPLSRSMSSDLSTAEESLLSGDRSDSIHSAKETLTPQTDREEVTKLQALVADHEKNLQSVREEYTQLQSEHKSTLDTVERLRTEAQRSRSPLPSSPTVGMMRRSTSQLISNVDRGQRSIVSLRTLLNEEFEDRPHHLESMEVHLAAATHELQSRLNRIQSLESDLQSVKKEMDMKSTIISGLTRERNSLKSGAGTPVDLAMVSQMRDQLIQKETELKTLYEGFAKREEVLQAELITAQSEVQKLTADYEKAKKSLEDHESRLKITAAELEAALRSVETLQSQQKTIVAAKPENEDALLDRAATVKAMGEEREQYVKTIDGLKRDLEQQISTNASHTEKIEELTQMHEAASKDIHEHSQIIQSKSQEIEMHKVKIANLSNKIKEAESAVEFHKHGLKTLHDAHANEIEEMKLSHAGTLAGYDDQIAELNIKHGKTLGATDTEKDALKATLEDLVKKASESLGHDTSADMLANHISDMAEEKKHVMETNKRLATTNAELEAQLTGRQNLIELEEAQVVANEKIANYQETIRNLANEIGNHEETIRDKETLVKKHEALAQALRAENEKKIALIEELEQQLQNSFDQHQNRVSLIQQQGSQALTEAQRRISQLEREVQQSPTSDDAELKKGHGRPQSPPTDIANRSDSISSNLRKSASIASLPSPPPAIPLPPLPTLPTIAIATSGNPSPPQSRHTSKEVAVPQASSPTNNLKDSQTIKRQSAIIEDQDSRIRTMEKHLHAEKQLTATLEEALVDLEKQSNKLRVDAESWKKKTWALEEEMSKLRKDSKSDRMSMQQVEEEVRKRRAAEDARAQLEERMKLLKQSMDGGKKKKKSALNCF